MSGESTFSGKRAAVLAGVIGVSFAVSLALFIFADDIRSEKSIKTDSYSRSAIGHRAFSQLLDRLGYHVLRSRSTSGEKARAGVLVIAEPSVDGLDGDIELLEQIDQAEAALIVLPKWRGIPSIVDASKIGRAELVATSQADDILETLGLQGSVVRHGPSEFAVREEFAGAPTIKDPQLVAESDLESLITTGNGTLLGYTDVRGTDVYVLSDPDVLSNHGLGKGTNAALAVSIVEALGQGRKTVVFDETMHGFTSSQSLWRMLFDYPLVVAVMHVGLIVVFLLWAAMSRFGAPLPTEPPIEPGKSFLIANTAALLRYGGHVGHVLRKYMRSSIDRTGRALHVPLRLGHQRRLEWLDRAADARAMDDSATAIDRDAELCASRNRPSPRDVVAAADRIHRFREEITRANR